ncbi:dolichyl-phosphate beta-glucosyltransferase [Geomonas sp.]|uniref:dolichyl-phosphate beta-glucosyltransferase n=1 Tax=Geomonas sp. TaxID=2651584 RepID=UPI002B49C0ED|nr:dolichyl-phosphate beta-glucosyltransferase [Geomonas sp.]HJV35192.1 dolichyl-phosphate beta-glucosyltransferase [Geomonas sp.]
MLSMPSELSAVVAADHLFGVLASIVLLMVASLVLPHTRWHWLVAAPGEEAADAEPSDDDSFFRLELRILRFHLDGLVQDPALRHNAMVDLSIVIPAYNERNRLANTVLSTIRWCQSCCPSYEIIVADDGSTDETMEICRIFEEYDGNFTALSNPHLGKGSAVRAGMLHASGKHVLFMDADGATPLKEIERLRAKLEEGFPVAIGSRRSGEECATVVERRLHRRVIGKVFAAIVHLFGVSGIGDTQCGFKMFKAEVVKEIFSRQRLNGFAFDVEVLLLARRLSLEIAEVPVDWNCKAGSKVNLVVDTLRMLADVFKVKLIHRNTPTQLQPDTSDIN